MQTTRPNVFALKNSGLDAFLYADIGAEANGSTLTVLSVLARLGKDPWAEAARWAALPRAAVIDSLAQSIAQMPLMPSTPVETRATAARLVQLLHANNAGAWHIEQSQAGTPSVQGWMTVTFLYCAMAFTMAVSAMLMPRPSEAIPTLTEQKVSVPGEGNAGAAPSVRDEPAAGQKDSPPNPPSK
jgi:hypothetical protein